MKKFFTFAGLTLFAGLLTHVFAAYQTLAAPSVAYPADFPKAARAKIDEALRRPDCKFLSGSALNAFTTLNYSGDTLALNLFLEQLAQCPGAGISVAFVADSLEANCDWQVSQTAYAASSFQFQPVYLKFVVRINLKSSKVKLEKLVIPDIVGPALSQTK